MASLKQQNPQGGKQGGRKTAVTGFAQLDTCKFRLRTRDEAEAVAQIAAQMFADPVRVWPGLLELMLNAIEHGCLGFGYEMKAKLTENGAFAAEAARRESLPENRRKCIELAIARKPDGVYAVVTDPGKGFAWKEWIAVDPSRAGQAHGRGIAKARGMCFDALVYNPAGNQVVAQVKETGEIEW